MADLFDLSKLKVSLQTSGLSQKNQPLYQVIWTLIDFCQKNFQGLATGTIGPTPTSNIINQTIQQVFLSSNEDGGDSGDTIPGPKGEPGANGMVPYYIAAGEKFNVPLYKQALFGMNIEVDGTLEIDGFLIEVGSMAAVSAQYSDTTNQQPATTNPTQVTFNTTDFEQGISFVSNTLVILHKGIYEFIGTLQVGETAGGHTHINIWFRLNGVDIANSNNSAHVQTANETAMLVIDTMLDLDVDDEIEIWMEIDNTARGAGLLATAATGTQPAVASAMISANRIGG